MSTCAACDSPLQDGSLHVVVSGYKIDVCSVECALALSDAGATAFSTSHHHCQQSAITVRSIRTASGRISYAEAGSGPTALFVHGVLVNKYLWRHQLSGLSDIRRCIAVDLLAHGDTEIDPTQDVSAAANARMLSEVIDALQIDQVDLIGNGCGGGIAQIFAAFNSGRVRTLTLTNCDTHDNSPAEAFKPLVQITTGGGMSDLLNGMLADKALYRSIAAASATHGPLENVSDEEIEIYLRPLVQSEQRTRDFERFVTALDPSHALKVESRLRRLHAPTLIVWGTDDAHFPVKWAHWLAEAIPGAKPPVEIAGTRSFFARERAELFNTLLRDHLAA